MDLETKAHLLSIGTVQLQMQVQKQMHKQMPGKDSRTSTAGPGAGGQSIFFQSGPHIVRLSVQPSSPLRIESCSVDSDISESAAIFEGAREVARGRLVEPLLHCPQQAYITVSERCIYDCKFCAVPRLHGNIKSMEMISQMTEEAALTGKMQAISLTSGVEVSPRHEAERVAEIVQNLARFEVPIGVSISPFPGVNRILHDAGANEVKYNLECADAEIFSRVCPGISFQDIMDALVEAVGIFGKNRVFTNIIVGLGESDQSLRECIDELTGKGIIPILRAVYPHPLRKGAALMERPSEIRLLDLARYLKRALERNGLDGSLALTGCYRCTGCDLIPGRDL